MKIMNGQFPSIEQVAGQYLENSGRGRAENNTDHLNFANILAQKEHESQPAAVLKFSKHASNRLSERNIELTDSQVNRLNAGTQAANEKGIQESLVLIDQLAFIVNVGNRTVITAMDQNEADSNVFTNIDGAVIA